MSIFIPSVTATTSEEQIQAVFHNLNIGVVSRVDFVERDAVKGGGRYMAFVHFEYWFLNNTSYHLQEKIVNEGQGRIVYNDPYYWIIMENSNPRTRGEIDLERRVEALQRRILYLEKVIGTHTRKFIENGIVTQTYPCSECWTVSLEDSESCDACGFVRHENTIVVDESESQSQNALDENADCLAMTGVVNSKITQEFNSLTPGEQANILGQQNQEAPVLVEDQQESEAQSGWWPWS
jgi:hypothetical protein